MADNTNTRLVRNYFAIWLALLIFLGLSTASAFIKLGAFNLVISLLIAAIKAGFVAMIFMQLRGGHTLFRVAACLGLYMAILLFALSSSDFLVAKIYPAPWESPTQVEANANRY